MSLVLDVSERATVDAIRLTRAVCLVPGDPPSRAVTGWSFRDGSELGARAGGAPPRRLVAEVTAVGVVVRDEAGLSRLLPWHLVESVDMRPAQKGRR